MDMQIIIFFTLIILAIILAIILWLKGQKKVVLRALALLVHKAEVYFAAGENQVKIDFVLKKIKSFINPKLQWLFNEEWIKKNVKIILLKIEKELGYNSTMKDVASKAREEVLGYAERYAKKSISTAVDYMTEKLISSNVNGDYNIVDNEQIKLLNSELKGKIGTGVNLKAFVLGETDFKGKNSAMAGLQFEKKF